MSILRKAPEDLQFIQMSTAQIARCKLEIQVYWRVLLITCEAAILAYANLPCRALAAISYNV